VPPRVCPSEHNPFGYGKSHSTLRASNVTVDGANVTSSGTATAEIKIRNSSTYDGTEVVKLCVDYKIASAATPKRSSQASVGSS